MLRVDLNLLDQFQPRSMFWITDYLGSSAENDFHEPGVVVVDVRDLNDGTNPPNLVWGEIRTALKVLKLGNKVCIRCAARISRIPLQQQYCHCMRGYRTRWLLRRLVRRFRDRDRTHSLSNR
jgi:hypothetical protein